MGGTIAIKRQAGVDVQVVFLSDGQAALQRQSTTAPAEIGRQRRCLAEQAGRLLDIPVESMHFLALPDGRLNDLQTGERHSAVGRLVDLIVQFNPGEIYAPHPSEHLPDHLGAYHLVQSALANIPQPPQLWLYLVWAWRNMPLREAPSLGWRGARRIDIRTVMEKKQAAMQTYLDDLDPQSGLPYCGELPEVLLKAFRWPYELLFPASELIRKVRDSARPEETRQ